MTIPQFQRIILAWRKQHRRSLPWRNTRNPYAILVSEIMLQQTQVSRVLPKYKEFLKAFPTVQSLAKAPRKKLLKVWQGLGYWRRALYLQETARRVFRGKRWPKDPVALEKFPGIGRYTARAIACFAFNNPEAFLDTNIRRTYLHFFFPSTRSGQVPKRVSDKEILKTAQKAVWKQNPKEWHYALFDYGALVLKDKAINKRSRHYHKQSAFEGSFRSFRTKVMRFLLARPKNTVSQHMLSAFLRRELNKHNARYAPKEIIASLLKDNLIKQRKKNYAL